MGRRPTPAAFPTSCRRRRSRMRLPQMEIRMARKRKVNPWTALDVKTIRTLAGKHGAAAIGKRLRRTEGAIRQKALALGISLRVR